MSKTLVTLNNSLLHEEEKVQVVARLVAEVESSKLKITDEDIKRLLAQLKAKLTAYTTTQEPIRKSEHTEKLKVADAQRDNDIKALFAAVRAYRTSKRQREQSAYHVLIQLYYKYKDITSKNYEEQSAVVNRLLNHLKSTEYSDDVSTLGLTQLVTYLTESQAQFETLYTAKVKDALSTSKINVRQIRSELYEEYQRFCEYVDALAWGKTGEQYTKLLSIINTGRKFSSETVNRRTGREKKKKQMSIDEPTTLSPNGELDRHAEDSSVDTVNEVADSALELATI